MDGHKQLPNLLLIGAAKAGTSTLASDLASTGSVFLPSSKEPHCLLNDNVLNREGHLTYEEFFVGGQDVDWRLDASTGYAKRDTFTGIPERAAALLGNDTHVVYLVRDPIARCMSHHFHLVRNLSAPAKFADALRQYPELIDVGLYHHQLVPWLDNFPREKISIVVFEEWMEDRPRVFDMLLNEIGIQPNSDDYGEVAARNQGTAMPAPRGPFRKHVRRLMQSDFYKMHRDSTIFGRARTVGRNLLMTKSKSPRPELTPSERKMIQELVQDDCENFFCLLGRVPAPWDAGDSTSQP